MSTDLRSWLATAPTGVAAAINAIVPACRQITDAAALGALGGLRDSAERLNAQDEVPQKLDVFADACLTKAVADCPAVAGWGSEEHEAPMASKQHGASGDVLVLFDPLDGSTNVEPNVTTGTIFSILPHPSRGRAPIESDFLQPGNRQLAAGYVLYGAATVLVLTVGSGVSIFTLDRRNETWILTNDQIVVAPQSKEFAINCSNQRFWEKPVQRYVAECQAGTDGPRSKDFNMRWIASFVAECHRILLRGGVYLYPRDHKEPRKAGRLRLLYEAAPLSMLIEQAGGRGVTGSQNLLDIVPDGLHQRVPVIIGSREEVERIVAYHAETSENISMPLFKTRSLFVQPQA